MSGKRFGKHTVDFFQKSKPTYLPPKKILEKHGRKARKEWAPCNKEFTDFMDCYNRPNATKMSCYTHILKLSKCLDLEKKSRTKHKSTMPYHIKNLYKRDKK